MIPIIRCCWLYLRFFVARVQGTIEGKHGPYNNTYCHVFTVRDGKIVEDIEYLDTALIHKSWYGRTLS